jgi:hypothetical protein
VLPGDIGVEIPTSKSFPMFGSFGPVPDVTVCGTESLLVQIIVSHTFVWIGFGENALSPIVGAPETIEALVSC